MIITDRVMVKGPDGEMIEKEEVNYEVTGALGKDKSTGVMYNGVLLKVVYNADELSLVVRTKRCSKTNTQMACI